MSSKTRSSRPVMPIRSSFRRSVSPSERFFSSPPSDSLSGFASTTASFCSSSTPSSTSFFHRPSSPTRVNLCGASGSSPASSVLFSINHRSTSPNNRPMAVSRQVIQKSPHHRADSHRHQHSLSIPKKTCMCSPTTHPGSFRCSLHKNGFGGGGGNGGSHGHGLVYSSNRLNARRSAMTNSLVRIGTVEGEWVKRALTALIRPSSHQQRRRASFQPTPSRLSVMSKAEDS